MQIQAFPVKSNTFSIFQFDMQGYTGGNENTDLTYRLWLSHNSILDNDEDYELPHVPNDSELTDDRSDNTAHTLNLNSQPLVRTVHYNVLKPGYQEPSSLFLFKNTDKIEYKFD